MNTVSRIQDWMRAHRNDGKLRLVVELGEDGETYAATLTDQEGSILFGASSYGSASVAAALAALDGEIGAAGDRPHDKQTPADT
jgi:hypothetical protein